MGVECEPADDGKEEVGTEIEVVAVDGGFDRTDEANFVAVGIGGAGDGIADVVVDWP